MAYADEFTLFSDRSNVLHGIVARAIDIAAKNVRDELPETPNHAHRLKWAKRVENNPVQLLDEAHRMMFRVLDNPTIAAAGNSATDSDVQFVVNGLVDMFAGREV